MKTRSSHPSIHRFDFPQSYELRLVLLLLVAFVFGGGGVGSAIYNIVVQLAALMVLAIDWPAVVHFVRTAPRGLVVLVSATLALPLMQLIPLPPAMWTALPGRDLVFESFKLVGASGRWMPISVAPARTLLAFLGLVPSLAVLVLGWNVPQNQRGRLLGLVVTLALAAALLGAVQLISGNTVAIIQAEGLNSGDLQATFANRNSSGLFFDLALIALSGWTFARPRTPQVRLLALCVGVLFAICVLLTRSRSSMALSFLVLPVLGYGVLCASGGHRRKILGAIFAGLIAVAFILGSLIEFGNNRLSASLHRFDSLEDIRPLIWADTVSAIRRYGLIGSGVGTFDEVFQVDESIEYLSHARAGRAHDDWLEDFLEAGVAGLLLLSGWLAWGATSIFRELRGAGRTEVLAGGMILVTLAIQSIVDYPLRNEAMLCIAALAFCLISPGNVKAHTGEIRKKRRRARSSSNANELIQSEGFTKKI